MLTFDDVRRPASLAKTLGDIVVCCRPGGAHCAFHSLSFLASARMASIMHVAF